MRFSFKVALLSSAAFVCSMHAYAQVGPINNPTINGTVSGSPTFSGAVTFAGPGNGLVVASGTNAFFNGQLTVGNAGTINLLNTSTALTSSGIIKVTGDGFQTTGYYYANSNYTYVNGISLTAGNANQPVVQMSPKLAGSINTGTGSPFYYTVNDSVASPGQQFGTIFRFEDNLQDGYDGIRQGMTIAIKKQVTSVSGGQLIVPFSVYAQADAGEGGTSSVPAGGVTGMNVDTRCNGAWFNNCTLFDGDIRALQPVTAKIHYYAHYGVNDAFHGTLIDGAINIDRAVSIVPGTGGAINGILFGGNTSGAVWPFDENNNNTSMIAGLVHTSGTVSGTYALSYNVGHGFYVPMVNFTTDAINTGGFVVDPVGQTRIGPLAITYNTTSATIGIGAYVQSTAATIVAGGTGYHVGDVVFAPNWGAYTVSALGGSASIATMTLLHPGWGATCLSGTQPLIGGTGISATATITCASAPNTINIGSTGQTVNIPGTLTMASRRDVQTFTASGTWSRPAFCATSSCKTTVRLFGPGSGGGGGAMEPAGTAASGGAAAGGGACFDKTWTTSFLSASVTVTIGTGGSGGIGATVNGNGGDGGAASGASTFGTYLTAWQGGLGAGGQNAGNSGGGASGGISGAGAVGVAGTGGAALPVTGTYPGGGGGQPTAPSVVAGNAGGSGASQTAQANGIVAPCVGGSGSGGSITASSTAVPGGNGGAAIGVAGPGGGGLGLVGSNAAGDGAMFPSVSGAGGGGGKQAGVGGAGGGAAAGAYGCGGAGGGSGTTGGGTGGVGCNGYAVVVTEAL